MPKERIISHRPGAGGSRIIFPGMKQLFTVDEVHSYNLNIKDFGIYLVGFPKEYGGEETEFQEPGVEYQMATQFIKNLHILSGLNAKRPILIHMKTCGGYWEEGMAIYDAIRACPNPVTILSYTHARSMSSIILQAADKRVLMPHSYFLFHEGTMAVDGTRKNVLSNVKWEEQVCGPQMLNIYVKALKQKGKFMTWSEGRIKKMLQDAMDTKEDVFLTPSEAIDWGFADEIFGADGKFDWESLRKFK